MFRCSAQPGSTDLVEVGLSTSSITPNAALMQFLSTPWITVGFVCCCVLFVVFVLSVVVVASCHCLLLLVLLLLLTLVVVIVLVVVPFLSAKVLHCTSFFLILSLYVKAMCFQICFLLHKQPNFFPDFLLNFASPIRKPGK